TATLAAAAVKFLLHLRAAEDVLQRDLALRMLLAYPALLPAYLHGFPYSLDPRPSQRWLENCELLALVLALPGRALRAARVRRRLVLAAQPQAPATQPVVPASAQTALRRQALALSLPDSSGTTGQLRSAGSAATVDAVLEGGP